MWLGGAIAGGSCRNQSCRARAQNAPLLHWTCKEDQKKQQRKLNANVAGKLIQATMVSKELYTGLEQHAQRTAHKRCAAAASSIRPQVESTTQCATT